MAKEKQEEIGKKIKYLSIIDYSHATKNNLEKAVSAYLRSDAVNRRIIDEADLPAFKKEIKEHIHALNKEYKRCRPLDPKWEDEYRALVDIDKDTYLWNIDFESFRLRRGIYEEKAPAQITAPAPAEPALPVIGNYPYLYSFLEQQIEFMDTCIKLNDTEPKDRYKAEKSKEMLQQLYTAAAYCNAKTLLLNLPPSLKYSEAHFIEKIMTCIGLPMGGSAFSREESADLLQLLTRMIEKPTATPVNANPLPPSIPQKKCECCGKLFFQRKSNSRFCSDTCRVKAFKKAQKAPAPDPVPQARQTDLLEVIPEPAPVQLPDVTVEVEEAASDPAIFRIDNEKAFFRIEVKEVPGEGWTAEIFAGFPGNKDKNCPKLPEIGFWENREAAIDDAVYEAENWIVTAYQKCKPKPEPGLFNAFYEWKASREHVPVGKGPVKKEEETSKRLFYVETDAYLVSIVARKDDTHLHAASKDYPGVTAGAYLKPVSAENKESAIFREAAPLFAKWLKAQLISRRGKTYDQPVSYRRLIQFIDQWAEGTIPSEWDKALHK